MAAAYQLIAPVPGTIMQTVLRVGDGAIIPFNAADHAYHAFLGWIAHGNRPDPAPPYVP